jgi:hypothetical protein
MQTSENIMNYNEIRCEIRESKNARILLITLWLTLNFQHKSQDRDLKVSLIKARSQKDHKGK